MVESSLFTTTAYTHSRLQIYPDHHYSCVLSKGGIFTLFFSDFGYIRDHHSDPTNRIPTPEPCLAPVRAPR